MITQERLSELVVVDTDHHDENSWCIGWLTEEEAEEIIKLAGMGIEYKAAMQSKDYAVITKAGVENPAEELLKEFNKMREELAKFKDYGECKKDYHL